MKFALFNDVKIEAAKGAKGFCQVCDAELIAKCGEIKANHWAHKSKRNCDPWWENEGGWHRSWKNKFPVEWQEVVHKDPVSGEKHIADVKTDEGWVLEFQYSPLKPDERRSRNAFYKKLVWVVDGLRRKRDIIQFEKIVDKRNRLDVPIPIYEAHFPDECKLLSEWHDKNVFVFFDFQETTVAGHSLWFLFPDIGISKAYLSPLSRESFINFQKDNAFNEFVEENIFPINDVLLEREKNRRMRATSRQASGFRNPLAIQRRRQRRL